MTRYISVRKTQEHKPAEQPSCLERREVNAVHLLRAMAFGMLIYIFLKAMLVLGEEAAITVSSLTTDSPNSWAKNDTEEYLEEPVLLKLTQSCLGEHHSYCINGLCTFHSELRKPICRCLTGYDGERCEHLTLNSYAHNSYEQYIAVGIGTGMLLSGIIAILYCYVRKRCRKLKSPYKV